MNAKVREYLSLISTNDGALYSDQRYIKISDTFSTIELYIGDKISFKACGSVYIIAMIKWLQSQIINNKIEYLKSIDMDFLINYFAIPKTEYRSVVQILDIVNEI